MATLLDRALALARDGLVRQALIFHIAIALPRDLAHARLDPLLASRPSQDADDALAALAFTLDPAAVEAFVACAVHDAPIRADCATDSWRPQDVRPSNARAVLRRYRSMEALDRAAYQHTDSFWYGGGGWRETFPWATRHASDAAARGDDERLLEAWLAHWPGHPGSDNVAARLSRSYHGQGDDLTALRWASRAATLPDGDHRDQGIAMMTALLELAPEGSPLLAAAIDPDEPRRNRTFLQYIVLRRRAADSGFPAALDDLRLLSRAEPDSLLARAWRERYAAPVPRCLDVGLAPLPTDDALRATAQPEPSPDPPSERADEKRNDSGSRDTDAVSVHVLPLPRLRAQFRAWETLAELARRRRDGVGDAVDLEFKQIAHHLCDGDALFPVYAEHDAWCDGLPDADVMVRGERRAEAEAWAERVRSADLAIQGFVAFERAHWDHALADRALLMAARAAIRAADDLGDPKPKRERIAQAIDTLTALLRRYPDSETARAAERAIEYWRRRSEQP
jgi:hypothetical protein